MQTRSTAQRRTIVRVVRSSKRHPTAQDVYEEARRELPRISLGTVYRTLSTLCDEGEISRVEPEGGRARYDWNTDNHAHVICVRCGRVEDLPDLRAGDPDGCDSCADRLLALARKQSCFDIPAQGLLIRGYCPLCRRA
ncbi:transcriptional repressor [Candidatus Fermentibacterales bacterium]|nr:transcriptional repressor [Candidatus Fermentibacterales bacterium]